MCMEWINTFEAALKEHDYEQCIRLLEVRSELSIQDDFQLGNVAAIAGDYFAEVAQHEQARQEYLEAVSAYEQTLKRQPDDTAILENKSLVLLKLANSQQRLAQQAESLHTCQEAIAVCNKVLVKALITKGNAMQQLASLQTRLAQPTEALQSYQEALKAYNDSLTLNPDNEPALNNKGSALAKMGDLQTEINQQEASTSYQEAIAVYDRVLALNPDNVSALNNKGTAARNLGNLQTDLARQKEALLSYQEAIKAYDQALSRAPDFLLALYNKALALIALGDLRLDLSQEQEALKSWQEALSVLHRGLEIAPDYERIRSLRDWLQESRDI